MGAYPFDRFTVQAKRVLTMAQAEAERAHHTYIGTEHLLLGLLQVEGAKSARILADLGVEIGTVRSTIERVLGRGSPPGAELAFPTSRTKRVVEIAFEEARRIRSSHVGTDYLLLALLLEGESIAAHALTDLGVTVERVREAITRLTAAGLEEAAGAGAPSPPWMPPPPWVLTTAAPSPPSGPDPRRMAAELS